MSYEDFEEDLAQRAAVAHSRVGQGHIEPTLDGAYHPVPPE